MKKIFSATILLSLIFLGHSAKADGPQIFITWSTDGYVPAGYAGKVLPINSSRIKARVAIFLGNGFLDLSQNEIAWSVDDIPLKDGLGAQAVEFDVSTLTQSAVQIKVQLPDISGGPYSKTINIPITQPEAVMEYVNSKNAVRGNLLSLTALPFFFKAQRLSDLNFSWQVNGQTPASLTDPQRLNVKSASGFQPGSQIQVSLNIQGGNKSASQTKTFTAQ
jgi:hypothetical protein